MASALPPRCSSPSDGAGRPDAAVVVVAAGVVEVAAITDGAVLLRRLRARRRCRRSPNRMKEEVAGRCLQTEIRCEWNSEKDRYVRTGF